MKKIFFIFSDVEMYREQGYLNILIIYWEKWAADAKTYFFWKSYYIYLSISTYPCLLTIIWDSSSEVTGAEPAGAAARLGTEPAATRLASSIQTNRTWNLFIIMSVFPYDVAVGHPSWEIMKIAQNQPQDIYKDSL